ncbi:MAG: hypothetical protein V1800_16455, partial [Candidatus Latescibacterota bacterium]
MVSAGKTMHVLMKAASTGSGPDSWQNAQVDPPQDLMPCGCASCSISRMLISMIARLRESSPGAGPIRLCVEKAAVKPGEKAAVPAGDYVKITVADPGPGPWREVMVRAGRRRPGRRDHPREHLLDAIRAIIKKHGGIME